MVLVVIGAASIKSKVGLEVQGRQDAGTATL